MFDPDRLEALANAYLDGSLTPSEKIELEETLLTSSRARDLFTEITSQHSLLREWALETSSAIPIPNPKPSRKHLRLFALIPLSAAACWIAISLLSHTSSLPPAHTTHHQTPSKTSPQNLAAKESYALLSKAVGVEWDPSHPPVAVGTPVGKTTLALLRGSIRLDFFSGARVVLEGPARLEILSQDLTRLEHGSLTASVPPPAEGFTVLNRDLRVIDRGTEFGMRALPGQQCEVHVFDGEVELRDQTASPSLSSLFEGHAVAIHNGQHTSFSADRSTFTDLSRFNAAEAEIVSSQFRSWKTYTQSLRKDPDLLVFYSFESSTSPFIALPNEATAGPAEATGTIIGCDPLPGRWPEKQAFGFARLSDRIRFRLDGSTPSLTLIASVRVDSLPHDHNALLSMAPDQIGEIHWKLNRQGHLLLGIRAAPELDYQSWERLESPPVVTEQDFGRWLRLATVIHGTHGTLDHYVNGRHVASATMQRRTPIRLSLANLGNFDAAIPYTTEPGEVRSFNGRMDEFLMFRRALTADEIKADADASGTNTPPPPR